MSRSKKLIKELFSGVGIEINGPNPWDIQVKNEKLYSRIISHGSLGFGESYMDAWWTAESIDQFFERVLKGDLKNKLSLDFSTLVTYFHSKVFNASKTDAFKIGQQHYDVGNDLYEAMLDKRLTYTCGYWKDVKTLDEAQEAKLDLVCKKLNLQKGQKILDIGSGWGSFIKFAAKRYGVTCVGLTVSKEQADYANANRENLPIETRLQDYRDINEKFDHIVSLGMFEHVGYKNYDFYMKKVRSLLKDDGLFLLHTIGANKSTFTGDPWILKYIFPNSMLPSPAQIANSTEGLFIMEDWHNFGTDYDKTLMAWHENFKEHWPKMEEEYGDRFRRMWEYYLLIFAASFRIRNIQLWQIVFSKNGVAGGYKSIR